MSEGEQLLNIAVLFLGFHTLSLACCELVGWLHHKAHSFVLRDN